MGKIIDWRTAEARSDAAGASVAPLLDWFDGTEMMASLVRLAPGARWETNVPAGSDQYLFVLSGATRIEADGKSAALAAPSWVTAEEGLRLALAGGAAEVLSVVVPPPGAGRGDVGFRGGFTALAVNDLPTVDLPEEKKRRTYLADAALAAGSHRGHAMIVRYTGETFTRKHHHPNAESLFVVLTGKVQFLVDGKDRVLGPGEAAFFPTGNSHGLKSADGNELSFLEFHVPGAFQTKYDD
jgi:quercetin dioxygenase-like cupin family protein